MRHTHAYTTRSFTTLTLPEANGRYEVFQGFACACGHAWSCTSYAQNTGRHLSLAELQAIKRREQARPQRKKGI